MVAILQMANADVVQPPHVQGLCQYVATPALLLPFVLVVKQGVEYYLLAPSRIQHVDRMEYAR